MKLCTSVPGGPGIQVRGLVYRDEHSILPHPPATSFLGSSSSLHPWVSSPFDDRIVPPRRPLPDLLAFAMPLLSLSYALQALPFRSFDSRIPCWTVRASSGDTDTSRKRDRTVRGVRVYFFFKSWRYLSYDRIFVIKFLEI